MTTGKVYVKGESNPPIPECCMCGDQGLSFVLFICKIVHFRSQHRYCSNLYPKAETYKICNWCLYQKNDTSSKTQNSSNSSSSHKISDANNDQVMIKTKRKSDQSCQENVKGQKGNLPLQERKSIKKPKTPEKLGAVVASGRRKVIPGGGLKDRLRRTKSEDVLKSRGKIVIRARTRRYKFLDDLVSSE